MNDRFAKNFSTCCARAEARGGSQGGALRADPGLICVTPSGYKAFLTVFIVGLALLVAPVEAKKKGKKARDAEELFNPLLGIDYSHWLQGAAVWIAEDAEIDAYLALVDDEAAAAFIETFWAQRAEGVGLFEKKPRQIFEERAEVADRRFSEGALPGRATDRGAVFIVHGEPEKIEFSTPRRVDMPYLEVWTYAEDAAPGLDGEAPQRTYSFFEDDDGHTIRYDGRKVRPSRRPGADPRNPDPRERGR